MDFLSGLFNFGKSLFQGGANLLGPAVSFGQNLFGGGMNPLDIFGGGGGGGKKPPGMPSIQPIGAKSIPRMGAMSPFTSGNTGSMFPEAPEGNKKKGWLDSLFPGGTAPGLLGLGLPAIGNMFGPKSPKVPDINSLGSVQALQNFRPGQSVSPEYKNMLGQNNDRLRNQRIKDLQAVYHSARPGTDYLSDTAYQRDLAEIERQVQEQSASDLASAEATFSSQELERLSQIAEMDIYSIMAQTGLEAEEANSFKEMFSNLGNTFLTNATRQPGGDLMSLFGLA